MENWRFIEENPDYMVSDHGRVLSFKGKSKLILCTTIAGEGYEQTELMQKGIYTKYYTHRLVAKAFIPNPKHLPQVNHLDGNTLNNHVSNLEWCDAHDNIMHAIRMGLRPPRKTGSKYSGVPCAVTDASGNALRAYPSMQAMSKGEHMNLAQTTVALSGTTAPPQLTRQPAQGRRFYYERTLTVVAHSGCLTDFSHSGCSAVVPSSACPAYTIPLHPGPASGEPAILPPTVRRRSHRFRIRHLHKPQPTRKEDAAMRDTIIIHCSATRAGQDFTAADIDRWHRARGFRSIGYHFVIRLDGTIEPGRDVSLDGAHCTGWNRRSIGICYVGGLDKEGRPADTRTEAQREALIRLVEDLRLVYPDIRQVIGHRDTSPDRNGDGIISPNEFIKMCPCFDVRNEFR